MIQTDILFNYLSISERRKSLLERDQGCGMAVKALES
jgi:hypothetical protein